MHIWEIEETISNNGFIRLNGYHHNAGDHSKLFKIVHQPDSNGCYGAIYKHKGHKKFSSFFPDHLTKSEVLEKTHEALENIIKVSEKGFVGVTRENIYIQFWLLKEYKSGMLIINSCYPLLKENI